MTASPWGVELARQLLVYGAPCFVAGMVAGWLMGSRRMKIPNYQQVAGAFLFVVVLAGVVVSLVDARRARDASDRAVKCVASVVDVYGQQLNDARADRRSQSKALNTLIQEVIGADTDQQRDAARQKYLDAQSALPAPTTYPLPSNVCDTP